MNTDIDEQIKRIINGDGFDNEETDDEDGEGEVPHQKLVPVIYEEKESRVADTEHSDKIDDYKFARSNLYGLLGKTNSALELALKLAEMSEHPRALEVVATLIKTSSDVSKDIMKLSKDLDGPSDSSSNQQRQNNTQINNYYNEQNEVKSIAELLDKHNDEEV